MKNSTVWTMPARAGPEARASGLSIAKEIVELHGGAIAASSSPVCTRFTVKLPRHQEEQQPAAAKKWGRIAKNGGKE